MREGKGFSGAQWALLSWANRHTGNVREAATALGTTVSAISQTRTTLMLAGYIEPWVNWADPIHLTPDGRHTVGREQNREDASEAKRVAQAHGVEAHPRVRALRARRPAPPPPAMRPEDRDDG